jgi:hypothetical protein
VPGSHGNDRRWRHLASRLAEQEQLDPVLEMAHAACLSATDKRNDFDLVARLEWCRISLRTSV